jgi:hypothetical protein
MSQNNTTAAQISTSTSVLSKDTSKASIKFTRIEQIAVERQVWEDNAFRTSNEQLYSILDKCYSYFKLMTAGNDLSAKVKDDLETHINLNGHVFLKKTHPVTKIIKVVFNQERRRTSTYSLVLRAAIAENVPEGGIPEFIRSKGGVQEISISKGGAKSSEDRAEAAKAAVSKSVIAELSGDAIAQKLDSNKANQQLVIVATQLPNGKLALNAVTYSESVVKAALAACFKDVKKGSESAAKEVVTSTAVTSLSEAITAAL